VGSLGPIFEIERLTIGEIWPSGFKEDFLNSPWRMDGGQQTSSDWQWLRWAYGSDELKTS